ncbi:hypothetical protein HYH02_006661 [Chlamydomonas schloesseri]|uniref:Uncharacterized protein n=1 Tax=Chlamydomonas schloesseri TaxID=2026947 RepID=A0A835SVP6_9CHLO|nr:hypothetical protein HYH02_006661 [Chlamydomonas schloesseri]|eukprot:KAG2432676.1 hypothetical protein HYH02_006661 [Chlamydomonas schloesseri]
MADVGAIPLNLLEAIWFATDLSGISAFVSALGQDAVNLRAACQLGKRIVDSGLGGPTSLVAHAGRVTRAEDWAPRVESLLATAQRFGSCSSLALNADSDPRQSYPIGYLVKPLEEAVSRGTCLPHINSMSLNFNVCEELLAWRADCCVRENSGRAHMWRPWSPARRFEAFHPPQNQQQANQQQAGAAGAAAGAADGGGALPPAGHLVPAVAHGGVGGAAGAAAAAAAPPGPPPPGQQHLLRVQSQRLPAAFGPGLLCGGRGGGGGGGGPDLLELYRGRLLSELPLLSPNDPPLLPSLAALLPNLTHLAIRGTRWVVRPPPRAAAAPPAGAAQPAAAGAVNPWLAEPGVPEFAAHLQAQVQELQALIGGAAAGAMEDVLANLNHNVHINANAGNGNANANAGGAAGAAPVAGNVAAGAAAAAAAGAAPAAGGAGGGGPGALLAQLEGLLDVPGLDDDGGGGGLGGGLGPGGGLWFQLNAAGAGGAAPDPYSAAALLAPLMAALPRLTHLELSARLLPTARLWRPVPPQLAASLAPLAHLTLRFEGDHEEDRRLAARHASAAAARAAVAATAASTASNAAAAVCAAAAAAAAAASSDPEATAAADAARAAAAEATEAVLDPYVPAAAEVRSYGGIPDLSLLLPQLQSLTLVGGCVPLQDLVSRGRCALPAGLRRLTLRDCVVTGVHGQPEEGHGASCAECGTGRIWRDLEYVGGGGGGGGAMHGIDRRDPLMDYDLGLGLGDGGGGGGGQQRQLRVGRQGCRGCALLHCEGREGGCSSCGNCSAGGCGGRSNDTIVGAAGSSGGGGVGRAAPLDHETDPAQLQAAVIVADATADASVFPQSVGVSELVIDWRERWLAISAEVDERQLLVLDEQLIGRLEPGADTGQPQRRGALADDEWWEWIVNGVGGVDLGVEDDDGDGADDDGSDSDGEEDQQQQPAAAGGGGGGGGGAAAQAAALMAMVAAGGGAGPGAAQAAGAQAEPQPQAIPHPYAQAVAAARQPAQARAQARAQAQERAQREAGPQWTVCLGRLRIRGRLGPALAPPPEVDLVGSALPGLGKLLGPLKAQCCPCCAASGGGGGGAAGGSGAGGSRPCLSALAAGEAALHAQEEAEEARWQALLGLSARRRLVVSQLTAPLHVAPRRLAMLLLRLAAPVEKLELRLPLTEAQPALLAAIGASPGAVEASEGGAGGSGAGGSGGSSGAGGSAGPSTSAGAAAGPTGAPLNALAGCPGGAANCHVATALGCGHVACRDWTWPQCDGASESDSSSGSDSDVSDGPDGPDAEWSESGAARRDGPGKRWSKGREGGQQPGRQEGEEAPCRCRGCRWGSELTAALQLLPLSYRPNWLRLVVAP